MAQVKVLKIGSTGRPTEVEVGTDDITMNSFTAGSVVLSGTGLDLQGQAISNSGNIDFSDPTTNTIEQTAGALVIDDIMAKDRSNVMQAGSDILFGSVGDVAGELDAFQLPQASALPTATPAVNSNNGFMVSYNGKPYHWNGSSWDDLTTAASTQSVINTFTAEVSIAIRDVVYISSADNVSPADNDIDAGSRVIGLAVAAATATNPVEVQSSGVMGGFTGLTAGDIYYLDGTAGAITNTLPPGASSKNIVQVGYAKSSTELFISIQVIAKRAAT